jgi:hypothetical protein
MSFATLSRYAVSAIAGISSSGSVTGTCTACVIAAATSVRLQIGTASGFLSERVAGFVGIRNRASDLEHMHCPCLITWSVKPEAQ